MVNRKLNVLLITANFPPESIGGATHNLYVAKHLTQLGCNVDVLTTHPIYPYGEFKRKNRLFSEEEVEGIRVMRLWTFQPTKPSPPTYQRLLQYLIFPIHAFLRLLPILLFSRKRYDVMISSHPPETTLFLGYLFKRFVGTAWVVEFRDLWLEAAASLGFTAEKGIVYKLSEVIRQKSLLSADIFAYVSKEIRDWFSKRYLIRAKELFSPNGIDSEECPISRIKERQIVHLGNMGLAYNLENLVKSILYVSDPNLKLVFVGGGDKKPDLLRLVNELDLEDRVKFAGILSHKEAMDLTSRSLVGLCVKKDLESLQYMVPIKILEYMGCGIPFVATGKGEIKRLANESEAGLVVENEPSVIAKAINSLIEDPGLRTKMGANGRNYVQKEFNNQETITKLHLTIIRKKS